MSEKPNQDIQLEQIFAEKPSRVYDSWLSTESLREWFFAPEDTVLKTILDPVVGGQYQFSILREGQRIEMTGKYLELDRPRRLVFDWGLSRVIIAITAIGTGSKLSLIHEDIPDSFFDSTKSGWAKSLDRLDEFFQRDP
jgi:uncharacterized protein YndB with AHSA1/START domain